MPSANIKQAGVWKTAKNIYVRQGGVWKTVQNAYIRQGGVWKKFYQRVVPFTFVAGVGSSSDVGFSRSNYGNITGQYAFGSITVDVPARGVSIYYLAWSPPMYAAGGVFINTSTPLTTITINGTVYPLTDMWQLDASTATMGYYSRYANVPNNIFSVGGSYAVT